MKAVRPRVLKVETAGDAVDVDDLAGEVEPGHELAFHRLEVDLVGGHSAARYELGFVHALAIDRERRRRQLTHKLGDVRLADLCPGIAFVYLGRFKEPNPEPFRK